MEAHSAPTLAIKHVESSSPSAFKLTRVSKGKSLSPVAIGSPYMFGVQPNSFLALRRERRHRPQLIELKWV
jgi:hypothetical protein